MSLKARVKYRMTELGMNPAQVSKAAGFAPTFVRDLLDGRKKSIRSDSLKKLAEALRTTPEWLNGEGTLEGCSEALLSAADSEPLELELVPIYDIRASAGPGSLLTDGEPLSYKPYARQALDRITRTPPDRLAEIVVFGDSMEPTLRTMDQILVDLTVRRVGSPGLYVLTINGDMFVKRCEVNKQKRCLVVTSDNPRYEKQEITDVDDLEINGRVVGMARILG